MRVPTALRLHDGNDRDELFLCLLRIKFWVLNLLKIVLDKGAILSYNTTPAEGGITSLCSCWLILSDHMFIISRYEVDHMWQLVCLFSALCKFLLCRRSNFRALLPPQNWWPHINHSALGFDHIFDHKQNRSTRRQECTRVWKSRFCVAERARKSKNG